MVGDLTRAELLQIERLSLGRGRHLVGFAARDEPSDKSATSEPDPVAEVRAMRDALNARFPEQSDSAR